MVGGTSTATGIDASTSAYGVTHAGDDAVAWARTSYDAGLPGPVYLDWVVTMTTPTVASGLAAQAPLTIALFVLGLALFVAGLVGAVVWSRRVARERHAALVSSERLQERLADMSAALSRVASGDLGAALPVEEFEDGDLREMAASFDSTIGRLRGLVGQAQEYGVALAQASVELQGGCLPADRRRRAEQRGRRDDRDDREDRRHRGADRGHRRAGRACRARRCVSPRRAGSRSASVDAMDAIGERVDAIARACPWARRAARSAASSR